MSNAVGLLYVFYEGAVPAIIDLHKTTMFVKTYLPMSRNGTYTDAEYRSRVDAEVERAWQTFAADGGTSLIGKQADQLLLARLKDPNFAERFRTLILSTTALLWTAFECVAADAWIASLNARPNKLARLAIERLQLDQQPEGLSSKTIPMSLAAKHGFDLRTCLGSILAERLDFSKVNSARKAYVAAFGKSEALDKALTQDLLHLEATRHLIVHRAGIVDEEYIRRTSTEIAVGNSLQIDQLQLQKHCSAAILAGTTLLQVADSWLTSNPS